jgi:peroxiredoxin
VIKEAFVKLTLLIIIVLNVFAACERGNKFTVEGTLNSAGGDTLYLEHRDLAGLELIDSVILKENGVFKFKYPASQNPEFYQLRLGNQVVAFAVDSAETLKIKADASDLYQTFIVEDSYTNSQLRKVETLTQQVKTGINNLENNHTEGTLDDVAFINNLDSLLTGYKIEISNLILANPSSAAAYYAVFQKIDDYLIFDPYDKQDYAMFGAVATSWNHYFPDTKRTKHLYDFTINALNSRRQQERQYALFESIAVDAGSELPDIVLPEVGGSKVALSSLKGKVVILDFVVYNADFSPAHNIQLNNTYDRYKSQGVEVYQISFDSDEHFWKISADNLPWITVRDVASVNSTLLSRYNVREIPTTFIMNREGDIVSRLENLLQLSEELNKVL